MNDFIKFSGGVLDENGAVIYRRVSGVLIVRKVGKPLKSWSGEFKVESEEIPALFDGFIVTDEGYEGKAYATAISNDSRHIEFRGIGPAPVDRP